MGIIDFTAPQTGSFLVDIILWLVNLTSSVAIGVILFTVLLKLITFPFDYVSRASMRKNSVKMEEMRPELEKLQKQYADNKDLYNQKMMALYKKNGYSMFGACLPTILTLVIFIFAINGFTAYSEYQNKQYFYDMSVSYNQVLSSGIETDGIYIKENKNGSVSIVDSKFIEDLKSKGYILVNSDIVNEDKFNVNDVYAAGETRELIVSTNIDETKINYYISKVVNVIEDDPTTDGIDESSKTVKYILSVKTTDSYIQLDKEIKVAEDKTFNFVSGYSYKVIEEKILYDLTDPENPIDPELAKEKNNNLKIKVGEKWLTFNEVKAHADQKINQMTAEQFIHDIQKEKSAETFRDKNQRFLWVKNIWVADNSTKHPVESSWSTFSQTYKYSGKSIGSKDYGYMVEKLGEERSAPNGYFILVALTAGISFVMQIVSAKAQKASMELQTVDGQGAQTQKIMKWMMPIMMAFFAFMYTAAFSIYIIISSVISIGTTFLINFIVDRKLKKEKVQKGQSDTKKIRGRVYTPKPEEKPEPKKETKKKKNDQFAHETGEDFLSGKADKKSHVRGRLK